MAQETKNAALICIILTIAAAIGAGLSIYLKHPLPLVILLLPAVGYEVYRTEGFYTKIASIAILAILLLELALVLGKFTIDLTAFLGERFRIGRYQIPVGDVKIVGPAVIVFLSFMLFRRTEGIYTRWLAIIILAGTAALIYVLNPELISLFKGQGLQEGLRHIR
jgi:hypothetical protein